MTYKEFVLLYMTLILGLACANIFYGLGQIIHDWKNIKLDWEYLIAPIALFMTVVDFWFHAFLFPYEDAQGSIIVFLIFLLPPVILFFNTLIIFPSSSNRCLDYVQFFQRNLRPNIFSYGLVLLFTVIQLYITRFMLDVLVVPLIIYIGICILIYTTNNIKIYRITVTLGIMLNLMRWAFEGLYQ